MKGYKEIFISFVIGFIAFSTLANWSRIRNLSRNKILNVEPTVTHGPSVDPELSLNWGLRAIRARGSLYPDKSGQGVVVAVIDTGCDIHHPDLRGRFWVNPGETGIDENGNPKSGNGIDDDGNGFIDDVHGWNFAEHSPDVTDDHGHGTHIAGIIAAKDGVAPGVSLMILKYYDAQSSGEDNLNHTVRAIRYAVRMGAKVINYSGGGIMRSEEEEEAIRWAQKQGVLFVAAAGNEGLNSDFFHFYPANYGLSNIISVAAVDRYDRLIPQSNFGTATAHIAAPGKNIYSTLPGGHYGYMTGTSQATAFVTGLAALLISNQEPGGDLKPHQLIKIIMSRGRRLPHLAGRLKSGSTIDVSQTLGVELPHVAGE